MDFSITTAFNSPRFSDVEVVLTTLSSQSYRRRLDVQSERASKARKGHKGQQASELSVEDEDHASEKLYCHKLVLVSGSEYFAAAFDFGMRADQDTGSSNGSDKRGREQAQDIIITLPNEHKISVAKTMLEFLYTHKLPQDYALKALLELLLIADEYRVASLRLACYQQLAKCAPPVQWQEDEQQLLPSAWAVIRSDSSGANKSTPAGAAAAELGEQLLGGFLQLEDILDNDQHVLLLCCLPLEAVLKLLAREDLVVRSENTVLLAALRWVHGATGKQCTKQQRQQVLHAVRLLQLSPWCLAYLLAYPGVAGQLPWETQVALIRHSATPPGAERKKLLNELPEPVRSQVGAWVKARRGVQRGMARLVELSVEVKELLDAIQDCCKSGAKFSKYGRFRVFNGYFVRPVLRVSRKADDTDSVRVWVGLVKHLYDGTQDRGLLLNKIALPVYYETQVGFDVKAQYRRRQRHNHACSWTGLGQACEFNFKNAGPAGDEGKASLADKWGWQAGDKCLVLRAKLLA